MERKTFDYKLKEKDKELLRLAEKESQVEQLMTNIKYYTKQDKDKEAERLLLRSKIRVYTMEDLLFKYEYYGPEYSEKDNIFYFNSPIPMSIFILFKQESQKFNFADFIILGEDSYGYKRWK